MTEPDPIKTIHGIAAKIEASERDAATIADLRREVEIVRDNASRFEDLTLALQKENIDLREMGVRVVEELKAAKIELEAARAANRWIPVSERLPDIEEGEFVSHQVMAYNGADILSPVVYCIGGRSGDGYYWKQGWWYRQKAQYITHWKPLPEPPTEGE